MFLLDTHTLLWWLSDDKRLSEKARNVLTDRNNVIFVSAVSVWEVVIKRSLGKLKIPDRFLSILEEEGFGSLNVTGEHAWKVGSLPNVHADPFDRLLIAQALAEGLTIITHDRVFTRYGCPCLLV